ncbi:ubiquitin carboxyl-terminal hydrolase [Anaeramoeba flamelloides]|uniref:Ubiquitin carboxyl-terminal hydrolase n=1 Tax=Anaeramoeba flamelloides TaxID=1746091 RepID=A0AAV7ZTK4_9EUKA|nr:ubiquitin carboxyl-terminal hydrolase [Anaeramoeba flamelloides]
MKPIQITKGFIINKFCTSKIKNNFKYTYKIIGGVVHRGTNINSGHYYSIMKTESKEWLKLDDKNVTKSSYEELKESRYQFIKRKLFESTLKRKRKSYQFKRENNPQETITNDEFIEDRYWKTFTPKLRNKKIRRLNKNNSKNKTHQNEIQMTNKLIKEEEKVELSVNNNFHNIITYEEIEKQQKNETEKRMELQKQKLLKIINERKQKEKQQIKKIQNQIKLQKKKKK